MGEPGPAAEFSPGEKVLCFHDALLNDAQILDVQSRQNPLGEETKHYLIHYHGWSKNWDEWVESDRLYKADEASLKLKAELQSALDATAAKGGHGRGRGRHKRGDGDRSPTKRARHGDGDDDDEEEEKPPPIKVVLPDELKLVLVEDWDNMTRQSKVTQLNRDVTISSVLADFAKHVESLGPRAVSIAAEVTAGLKVYFRTHVGACLLYDSERRQLADLKEESPDADVCEAFGPEHLLRLLIKLPTLMATDGISPKGMVYLTKCIEDLVDFLKLNSKALFKPSAYVATSAAYAQ